MQVPPTDNPLAPESGHPTRTRRTRRHLARVVTIGAAAIALASAGLATGVTSAGAQTTPVAPTPPVVEPTPLPPPPPEAPYGLPVFGRDLGVGDSGPDVSLVQFRLGVLGFFFQDAPEHFGESTRHAVVAYQKFYGMPRTGRVDFWTRARLALNNDRPTPARGGGGRVIEVDLGRQVLVISTNGSTDGVFDISSGKRSTPTPRGSFRIGRQINGLRRSGLGTLWRPKYFKGGYALHGSPSVPAYAASHGCVRLTNQEIDYIWGAGLAPIGTPVIVY